MLNGFGTAPYLRERAEEARARAAYMHDKDAKRRMLYVADSYESLAKLAEDRAAGRLRFPDQTK
jgi:hypothetical protein